MSGNPVIKLSGASIFQKEMLVLSDLSISVDAGEFLYLIGKTGSGKSSLLKTLYADLPLQNGEAEVAGVSLKNIKRKDIPMLRRKLGIIFQDFQLLPDRTVYDNLAFVLKVTGWKDKIQIASRIEEVLAKVDLKTKGHKMPHQLSGGEQQRVAIGRALLNEPDIIFADEPTGNLDPETSLGIMRLLSGISKNKTAVVMATHNYALIEQFPFRVLKCESGKLFEVE